MQTSHLYHIQKMCVYVLCRHHVLYYAQRNKLATNRAHINIVNIEAHDIPTDPLPCSVTSMSWSPDVALHSRTGKQIHESSYSMLWFMALMFFIAVAFCFIPWEERAFLGRGPKVKYIIAGGIVWGCICIAGGYWIRNIVGQRIIVDSAKGTITIQSQDVHTTLPLTSVVGIQLCGGKSGYQTNIVYRSEAGDLMRHFLYSYFGKRLCLRLARQYQAHCNFPIYDQTDEAE